MKIFIADSYELMSKQAADDIAAILQRVSEPLVCVASGDSPKGLYKEWKHQQDKKIINVHNWYFLGLDEWIGLGENDEGSCRYMLNRDVFHPLEIRQEKICCFDGNTTNAEAECKRIENYIHQHTGIDIAILGLGMNGHIGLNEPGTSPQLYSHVSTIHPVTNTVGQKYFSKPQQLTQGITLGIATLMKAKHLFLLVSGQKKAAILKQAIEGDITEEVPATLLHGHSQFYIYADKEAASMLKHQNNQF
jgi:galactosamine-6-phosphate isomerase